MQHANPVNSSGGGEVGNGGVATSPAATGATGTATTKSHINGGRFDFDDGGTYCGGWEEGKAHGHGVCTGPKGQGAYSGSWHYGFEVSGVYTWPSGSTFEGQWQNGKRHGLGVETRGRWIYRGEWTQGFKGRYGVRQSNTSTAKYEGTWANGLQDGYGSETYADDGTYQGQWLRGMRHGYGVRTSAPFGKASKYRANKTIRASMSSLRSNEGGGTAETEKRDRRVDDSRGGFVLKMNSGEQTVRRRSLGSSNTKRSILPNFKFIKQRSTGDLEKKGGVSGSIRSTGSSASWVSTNSVESAMTNASIPSDSNASFVVEDEQMDPGVTETYMGEWKNDKRTGFGVSERSDGLKYEGEWYCNKKYGYGVTTFSNGEKEEGKYKNNVLITSKKKKSLFMMRSATFRERIDAAVSAAQRASKIALQKADIAISRTATARGKAEQADFAATHARTDSDVAQEVANQYAPDFKQPGLEKLKALKEKFKYVDSLYKTKEANLANDISQMIPNNNNPNSLLSNHPNQFANNQMHHQQNQIGQHYHQVHGQTNQIIPNKIPAGVAAATAAAATSTNLPFTSRNQNPNPSNQQMNQNDNFQIYPNNPSLLQQQQHHPTPPTKTVTISTQNEYKMNDNALSNDLLNVTPSAAAINRLGRNSVIGDDITNATALRRGSRRVSGDRPYLSTTGSQQSSIDHFDHYKRPPSRDSSVDRYSRATGRLSTGGSRQPSIDRNLGPSETPDRNLRSPSAIRGTTPAPMLSNSSNNNTKNGNVMTGNNLINTKINSHVSSPPFEDIIIKKKSLGQDIIPSPNQPKRTESLYVAGNASPGPKNDEEEEDLMFSPALMARRASESWIDTPPIEQNLVVQSVLQRKKSLPDVQELPRATGSMSREEVSALGSARREEVRRQIDEKERLRANPLLYLISPQVKDWFSRQQLVIVVLFVNISLAIMFIKLLT